MQKLHLVGFTTDLDGLIFSARKGSKAGGYVVPLDGELMSTIAEAERLRNGDKSKAEQRQRVRPDSRLTPREIQAQLRSGRSIPEVAAEAGVDPEWVERFAVPIVAEQAQMVERARAMTFSKQRLGQSTQPVGTSVRWNLADKGVAISEEAFDQGWSAFQLQDEVWMIRFRYTSRTRLQVAEWELDLGANTLTSRNRLASELGYVEKGRRPPALPAPPPRVAAAPPVRMVEEVVVDEPEPEPEEAPEPVAPRRPARKAARRPRRRSAPKKAPAQKRKPAAKRSTKKATAKKAVTKKKPVAKKTVVAKKKAVAQKKVVKKKKAAPRKIATRPAAKKVTPSPAVKRTPRPTPATAERASASRAETPKVEAVRRPRPRPAQARRPRIAADSAKDAAAKRAARPVRRTPPRSTSESTPTATAPTLSGPLARSLLARRLAARNAAEQGNGGHSGSRPLRVR